MEEADYRFFVTRIKALEAETSALKRVLEQERASFDVYMTNVRSERKARSELDKLNEAKIARLSAQIERLRKQKYWPGLILGGGWGTDGDGLQGVVGLGWKVGF